MHQTDFQSILSGINTMSFDAQVEINLFPSNLKNKADYPRMIQTFPIKVFRLKI